MNQNNWRKKFPSLLFCICALEMCSWEKKYSSRIVHVGVSKLLPSKKISNRASDFAPIKTYFKTKLYFLPSIIFSVFVTGFYHQFAPPGYEPQLAAILFETNSDGKNIVDSPLVAHALAHLQLKTFCLLRFF